MTILDGSLEVDAPARAAYEQWLRIQEFPGFTEIVEQVDRIDAARSLWKVNVGGRREWWEAETTEVIPEKRIAWRSRTGSVHSGVVNFHPLSEETCLVTLHLQYAPRGLLERLGDEMGVVDRLVQRFLDQFGRLVESGA